MCVVYAPLRQSGGCHWTGQGRWRAKRVAHNDSNCTPLQIKVQRSEFQRLPPEQEGEGDGSSGSISLLDLASDMEEDASVISNASYALGGYEGLADMYDVQSGIANRSPEHAARAARFRELLQEARTQVSQAGYGSSAGAESAIHPLDEFFVEEIRGDLSEWYASKYA